MNYLMKNGKTTEIEMLATLRSFPIYYIQELEDVPLKIEKFGSSNIFSSYRGRLKDFLEKRIKKGTPTSILTSEAKEKIENLYGKDFCAALEREGVIKF